MQFHFKALQRPVKNRVRCSGGQVGALATALLLLAGCGSDSQPEDAPVLVRSMVLSPAGSDGAGARANYAGTISSRITSEIAFRVPGRVIARNFDVGDRVAAGSILARLDPAPFRNNAQSADAAVVAASAELAQAESDVARNAPLAADRIVAAAEMERLITQRDAAAARLRDARAKLAATRDDVRYTELRAPIAGVVTAVTGEVGQYFIPGQTMFTIAQPAALEAVVDVPESIVGSLRQGGSATVTVASSETPISGRIREIAPAADPASRTYRVKVELNSPGQARIGMTVRVAFEPSKAAVDESANIKFVVPRAAITNDARQQPAVWVIDSKGVVLLRPVTLGDFAGTNVTIVRGVKAGERIVTAGAHRIDAGQRVRPWSGEMP